MLTALRYTLAAIFLAVSAGCLGLWWRSITHHTSIHGRIFFAPDDGFQVTTIRGRSVLVFNPRYKPFWAVRSHPNVQPLLLTKEQSGRIRYFGLEERWLFFPTWYPALVFALAAVGVLRLGKPFTIRSALIATAVVAALLGMPLVL